MFFLLFGQGRVLFFAVWAGATPLPKQQKLKHAPARTAKKKHATPRPAKKNTHPPLFLIAPLRSLIFSKNVRALYVRVRVFFCCLGRGGTCFIFCCLGGGVFYFLLFGRCACIIFCCSGGDGSSLTYRPAWLGYQGPNNKKKTNSKKKCGFP